MFQSLKQLLCGQCMNRRAVANFGVLSRVDKERRYVDDLLVFRGFG